jgi:hypothetical protein
MQLFVNTLKGTRGFALNAAKLRICSNRFARTDTPRPLLVFFKRLARSGPPSREGNYQDYCSALIFSMQDSALLGTPLSRGDPLRKTDSGSFEEVGCVSAAGHFKEQSQHISPIHYSNLFLLMSRSVDYPFKFGLFS